MTVRASAAAVLFVALALSPACAEVSPPAPSTSRVIPETEAPPAFVEKTAATPPPVSPTVPPPVRVSRPSRYVELAPSQGDLSSLVKLHAERAKAEGLVPFVEFFAVWCPPCKALKKWKDDARLVEAFRGTYVIAFDVDDWTADEFKKGGYWPKTIPVFYALDADARPTGRTLLGDAWGKKDVPEKMAPVLHTFFGVP